MTPPEETKMSDLLAMNLPKLDPQMSGGVSIEKVRLSEQEEIDVQYVIREMPDRPFPLAEFRPNGRWGMRHHPMIKLRNWLLSRIPCNKMPPRF